MDPCEVFAVSYLQVAMVTENSIEDRLLIVVYGEVTLQLFPKRQILDSSKLKEFADDNFKFDENGRKLAKRVEKHCGKRRNCSLRAIYPFPTVFSKGLFHRGVKRCHCVGMG